MLIAVNAGFSKQISALLGISYSVEQRRLLQKFIIYLCPVILFTSFSGISNGILDANERFVPSKLLSLFFSTAIIVFTVLFREKLGIKAMMIGFLFGYGIHTLYVLWLAKKYFTIGTIKGQDRSIKWVLKNTLTLVIGNSVVDLGHIVDKIIASSLMTGSVSYLYYGQVISNDLVNAVIITTVGTVLLPSLTRMVANRCDGKDIAQRTSRIMSIVLALLLGITALYFVEGHDLIKLFFERGSFTATSTDHVLGVTMCYAVGFAFIAVREILTKVHYAYRDTASPMRNGIIGVGINTVLSILLSKIMGVSGVALATSISMAVVAMMMCFSIKKHIGVFPLSRGFFVSLIKSIIAIAFMIASGVALNSALRESNYIVRMCVTSLSMVFIYAGALAILKHDAISEIVMMAFRSKAK